MASRYSAARPKRAGELYAREIHGKDEQDTSPTAAKKVKFDVRNPSHLAPDAREDDDVLDADVIGKGGLGTKRGAVNVDGYDSDSDTETFLARAARRGGPADTRAGMSTGGGYGEAGIQVDLNDQLDNYDKRLREPESRKEEGEEDDDDMFAEKEDNDNDDDDDDKKKAIKGKKTWKEVRFMDAIQGEEEDSRAGGRVTLDASGSDSDDSSDPEADNPPDEEVGAGGRKTHAPKLDAFHMRQEQEEGAFDEAGNYIRKAADPDAQHDRWLEGIGKKAVRAAAKAHAEREAALLAKRVADDGLSTADLLGTLIARLQRGETVLEALARLGRLLPKKKQPKWKTKRKGGMGGMDIDTDAASSVTDTPAQVQARADIEALTEAADHLLHRDFPDIYDTERERLQRQYRAETGDDWKEEEVGGVEGSEEETPEGPWEYRWADGRADNPVQGPFDGATMQAWQDAGYFAGGIEVRREGTDRWEKRTSFAAR